MKYIIEVEDEPYMREDGVDYYTCKSARWYKLAKTIINRLTPYTEPDRKAIEDEVWNFVDFMAYEMNTEEREECFGKKAPALCVHELAYQEAKSKYEAWLKQKDEIKDEIKVGEEVTDTKGCKGIATYIQCEVCDVLWEDGCVTEDTDKKEFSKTGRHFPEVAELLKKLRGDNE